MRSVLAAHSTELVDFQAIRVISFVLLSRVILGLALGAGQVDYDSNISGHVID